MRSSAMKARLFTLLAAIIAALLLSACGGSAPPAGDGGAVATAVSGPVAFSAEQAAPYLTIADEDGILPCGVFDVGGHGEKTLPLSGFPACTAAEYFVACLNGEGQWVRDFISDVRIRRNDNAIQFESAQEGICALFPQT